jgi:hypothetical protein
MLVYYSDCLSRAPPPLHPCLFLTIYLFLLCQNLKMSFVVSMYEIINIFFTSKHSLIYLHLLSLRNTRVTWNTDNRVLPEHSIV